MWFTSFRNVILFTLCGHVLFAKLCTMAAPQVSSGQVPTLATGGRGAGAPDRASSLSCPQLRSWMYAVYGVLAVLGIMGPWYLLLLLGHCVGLYMVSLLGQPWLCLGLGLASLASFKMDPLISWQVCTRQAKWGPGRVPHPLTASKPPSGGTCWPQGMSSIRTLFLSDQSRALEAEGALSRTPASQRLFSLQSGFVTGTFDLQEVLFQGGSGFTVLRCTSFALESCAQPGRRYSLADLLKYNFYLPFFFFGPVMTFDRFHEQVGRGSKGAAGSPSLQDHTPEDPHPPVRPQVETTGRGQRFLPSICVWAMTPHLSFGPPDSRAAVGCSGWGCCSAHLHPTCPLSPGEPGRAGAARGGAVADPGAGRAQCGHHCGRRHLLPLLLHPYHPQ